MYHTTTPHTLAHNNIIHAPPLLYDRDDARAAVTPRTFLIDFCSRKITDFSPPPHPCRHQSPSSLCRIDYRRVVLLFRYCDYSHSHGRQSHVAVSYSCRGWGKGRHSSPLTSVQGIKVVSPPAHIYANSRNLLKKKVYATHFT